MFDFLTNFFKPKTAKEINLKMINCAVESAFRFFKDEEPRKLLNFEKLDQIEQDRIFNELVMTAILAIVFALNSRILYEEYLPDSRSLRAKISFLKDIKNQVFNDFLEWYSGFGIDKKYIDLFEKCLKMRYDEYQEDKIRLIKELPKEDIFDYEIDNELAHHELCAMQSLVVGSLFHIKRGETSPEDIFVRPYKTWLFISYGNLKRRVNKI